MVSSKIWQIKKKILGVTQFVFTKIVTKEADKVIVVQIRLRLLLRIVEDFRI